MFHVIHSAVDGGALSPAPRLPALHLSSDCSPPSDGEEVVHRDRPLLPLPCDWQRPFRAVCYPQRQHRSDDLSHSGPRFLEDFVAAIMLRPAGSVPFRPAVAEIAAPVETDDTLVVRIIGGDVAAFTVLVERYKHPVYALAYRLLGNATDAEDAAQETFVRAYTRLTSYQLGSRFGSWLLAITSHWCIDSLRRKRALSLEAASEGRGDLGILASIEEEPEIVALHRERQHEVRAWLDQLPAPYRAVLELRYWHDLSYNEISETTGLPVSTVRMRLFRARQLLSTRCGTAAPTG